MTEIRAAKLTDLGGITEIYNSAISKTTVIFDTNPRSIKEQEDWFEKHGEKYPVYVAVENKEAASRKFLCR